MAKTKKQASMYDDVMAIENQEGEQAEYYAAIQRQINAGNWSLQGSFGRTMMGAIEGGYCMLGTKPARDYWGNRIPSRSEVQEGTKGSRGWVVNAMGEDWAAEMEKQP